MPKTVDLFSTIPRTSVSLRFVRDAIRPMADDLPRPRRSLTNALTDMSEHRL